MTTSLKNFSNFFDKTFAMQFLLNEVVLGLQFSKLFKFIFQ